VRPCACEPRERGIPVKPERDILWAERTRAEFADYATRGGVVVVPIGSIEQHGLHLPVDTDCHTAEYVARTAARLVDDVPVLVTPTIACALSPHHMAYGGTITLRLETLLRVLSDLCECIVAHGFERILFVNGHGGNSQALGAAALELRHRLDRQIRAVTWFDLVHAAMDALREGPGHEIGHSGELETSAMLFLDPGAVRAERYALVDGVTDDPALATGEKGRRLMQEAARAVAAELRAIAAAPGRHIVGIERAH